MLRVHVPACVLVRARRLLSLCLKRPEQPADNTHSHADVFASRLDPGGDHRRLLSAPRPSPHWFHAAASVPTRPVKEKTRRTTAASGPLASSQLAPTHPKTLSQTGPARRTVPAGELVVYQQHELLTLFSCASRAPALQTRENSLLCKWLCYVRARG